ncbi:peroxiredoxin family protein [Mucilaginibacter segetis]|uniref:Thioredoxin family protein n=1 Tax=Mucilaginibacter segetis TaxID=2793071 RepID=A0A934PW79_9SPHI|nr:thioredoxin-like domain-containing protein [Mucilaginibacter segetis]MBK0380270.1 thioredoxin family protein [Mucilaginibacter segetis]
MKILYLFSICLLLAACNNASVLDMTVTANGIKNGTVILKQHNEIVLSHDIKNGEMKLKDRLEAPGYYSMSILNTDEPLGTKIAYDIYLENGDYNIQVNSAALEKYPEIASSSEIQKQLSAYYKLSDKMAYSMDREIDSLKKTLESKEVAALSSVKRAKLYEDTRKVQQKRRQLDLEILKTYTEKNPKSLIGAHIMAQQAYFEYPIAYHHIFEKFSPEVQTTDDGLKISNKLNAMLGVMPDAVAPDITGNTPEGKAFDKNMVKNKVTLVEFWRSSHQVSKLDHQKMLNGLIISDYDRKKFGILSVSLDTSATDWKSVIQQDKLNWLQVSDLKGDESPNVSNWNITKLPTYFLIDENWHIIKADIDLIEVDSEVHDYLKAHP